MTRRRWGADAVADAVVVGGGHNGLVAANLLADAGWEVLVLEATSEVGGAVRSGEITAPGFCSDIFSAFYPLAAASPVLNALDLQDWGLRWTHAPDVLAHVFPDGRSAVLSRDPEATAESVAAFARGDRAAWLQIVEEWRHIEEPFLDALFQPFPPIRAGARLARRLGLADGARLARLALLSARRFGEETFSGAGARMLVAGCAGHADIPVDSSGSAIFGWLMAMVGQTHGFPVPRGGAAGLVDALVRRLRARGGVIRTDAPVAHIPVSEKTVNGVVLESGERVGARRAVLADVNAMTLYRDLVGYQALPARFVDDLTRFQWDPATVKLDWALRAPIPWKDLGIGAAGTVHLGVDLDGMSDFNAALKKDAVPDRPFVLLGQMAAADPSRAPQGAESVWAYTHVPVNCADDPAATATAARRVEEVIEKQAPGFRDLVVGRHVMGPGDLDDRNPNLRHGAINGGTAQLHQEACFRPTVGLGGAVTPLDRLFLAGSSAHPGGGVHGGPGSNAAQAALRRAGVRGAPNRLLTRAFMRRLYS